MVEMYLAVTSRECMGAAKVMEQFLAIRKSETIFVSY